MRRFDAQKLVAWEAQLGTRKVEVALVIVVLGIPIVIAFAHGIDRPFHIEPDAGITWVYQTLLVTDGLHQTSYDHSGFLHFILLGAWFQILDWLGLVSGSALHDVQNSPDVRAAFVELIHAARWFSGIVIGWLAALFYFGLRYLTGYRIVAFVAALLLAVSTGFVEQATRIHTELFSAFFTFAALFLVVVAARTINPAGLVWLALAGTCAVLALLAKMQALPLLLGLVAVALAFGVRADRPHVDPLVQAPVAAVSAVALPLLAIAMPALVMTAAQLAAFDEPALALSPRIAQLVFAAYLLVGSLLYAAIYRPHWKTAMLGAAALAAGTAAGLYVLFIHHDKKVFEVLVNVVDHMTVYAPGIGKGTPLHKLDSEQWWFLAAGHLLDSLHVALRRGFLVGVEGKNLLFALYWSLTLGCLWAAAQGKWRLTMQMLIFLGMAIGMETFCRMRSFAPWYYIYVEPWVIIGNAVLSSAVIKRLTATRQVGRRRDPLMLVVVGIAALAVVPGLLADAFTPRSDPLQPSYCGAAYDFAPRLPGLVCFEQGQAPR